MNPEKPKTPQEELEELLRQAGGQPPVSQPVNLPKSIIPGKPRVALPKINPQWLIIGVLVVVLLLATIFFASGLFVQKGAGIELRSNQDDLKLTIGKKTYEDMDSGEQLALRPGTYEIRANKDGFLEFVATARVVSKQFTPVTIEILPIPELKQLVVGVRDPRLNADGTEISYLDPGSGTFKTQVLDEPITADLFRGSFDNVQSIMWSPTGQAAIVQFAGQPAVTNVVDNRFVAGRFLPVGERPQQAPALSNGTTTWLFDEQNKGASGWQPVWLSENIRQVTFAPDGGKIIYIYEGADGEYSLVEAQPDGLEWERVITNLPRFDSPKMMWSSDSRYLVLIDGSKVYLADLLTKAIEQVFSDWVIGTPILFSPGGQKISYVAGSEAPKLMSYDLITRETKEVPGVTVGSGAKMVWLNNLDLLIVDDPQTFRRVGVESGRQSMLPYAGTQITGTIETVEYSEVGHVLMVVASGEVFYMRL